MISIRFFPKSDVRYFIAILFFHVSKSSVTESPASETTLSGTSLFETIQNKTEEFIPSNYVKSTIPPTSNGEPIQIDFSVRVFVISSVNVRQMDFSIDMYIKQEWQDTRIIIPEEMYESGRDFIHLSSEFVQNLWQPDLYLLNSKIEEKPTLAHKYSSVTLFKNKTILSVARLHAVVACQMEFFRYPMDTQICPIAIESFAHNNKLIKLKWMGNGVTILPEMKHLQYHIASLHFEEVDIYTAEKNGNFSRLVAYFVFERQIGHHIIQIYAPSTLIVALSWFSFWLDFDAIPGRVTLLVTCQLSLVTMFGDLRDETPPVDYIKAVDIWMAACMLSVFGAVAEFVIAKILFGKYNELKKKESEQKLKNGRNSTISEFQDPNSSLYSINFDYKTTIHKNVFSLYWITSKGTEKVLWKEVDRYSRSIFPIIFLVFTTIYWSLMIYNRDNFRRLQALVF